MNTNKRKNLSKVIKFRLMKKIIILACILNSIHSSAQEIPPYRDVSASNVLTNNCTIGNLGVTRANCNLIFFCYDASGNRVVRYKPICSSTGGGGGGWGQMLAKSAVDTSDIITALEAVMVSPNPTFGITNIEFDTEIEDAKIEIYDMQGRSISSHSFSGKKTTVDLTQQSAGTYYIIISRNKAKVSKAVIKQ